MIIQTFSGKKFDILNPTIESVDIVDIFHSISNLCRYTGHSSTFYSVAEHSVFVSQKVPNRFALLGLLHDAAEAYIGDLSTPLKYGLPDDFRRFIHDVEYRILGIIFEKYGIDWDGEFPTDVKEADTRMLITEKRDLHHDSFSWANYERVEPYSDIKVHGLDSRSANIFIHNRACQLGLNY